MGTIKLHKTPYGWRFIAGSAKAPLTPRSIWITRALKALGQEVDNLWNQASGRIPRCQAKGCFIISNSAQAVEKVRRFAQKGTAAKTYDFSTTYTTLPLTDLKLRLRKLIVRLFQRRLKERRHRFFIVRDDGTFGWVTCRSGSPASEHEMHLDAEQLCDTIDALVDRAFIVFGGKLSSGGRHSHRDKLCWLSCESLLLHL
jgi:hypothetical protein